LSQDDVRSVLTCLRVVSSNTYNYIYYACIMTLCHFSLFHVSWFFAIKKEIPRKLRS